MSPFYQFEEASEAMVHHYREVAKNVHFGGILLEKWVVDSLLNAAEVHLHLFDNPPLGTEHFLDKVDARLRWFLHAPAFFFREETKFPYRHADDACAHLAVLGMALLQRDRLESADACGSAIRSIAHRSAKAENSGSYTSAYGFADCVMKLELLARAADALTYSNTAAKFRALGSRPEDVSEERWPEYVEAVATRMRQMEDELEQGGRGYGMRPDPVTKLRDILRQSWDTQTG